MTSNKKHYHTASSVAPKGIRKARRGRIQPSEYQAKMARYLAFGLHLLRRDKAKSITQVAIEAGMSVPVARYWLRREHYGLWLCKPAV